VSSAHDKYIALQRHRNAAPLALDPRTTALVIVDMQEYFLNPASPFSRVCDGRRLAIIALRAGAVCAIVVARRRPR
jgi:isochorismate hydrolase